MEAAIRRGDITWHANPLTSEDEVYDADTLRAAIDVSHELNARFGRANSRWVGQEDDPGGTRGIIPVLAEKGVKGFYVGYNDGSMNLVPLEGAPKIEKSSSEEVVSKTHQSLQLRASGLGNLRGCMFTLWI